MPYTRPALLGLVHLLRGAGVIVPTGQVLTFFAAAGSLAPVDAIDVYYAGRSTLISHARDLPVYRAVFRALFVGGKLVEDTAQVLVEQEVLPPGLDAPPHPAGDSDEAPSGVGAVASEVELLRHRRFDQATPAELLAMRELMARILL